MSYSRTFWCHGLLRREPVAVGAGAHAVDDLEPLAEQHVVARHAERAGRVSVDDMTREQRGSEMTREHLGTAVGAVRRRECARAAQQPEPAARRKVDREQLGVAGGTTGGEEPEDVDTAVPIGDDDRVVVEEHDAVWIGQTGGGEQRGVGDGHRRSVAIGHDLHVDERERVVVGARQHQPAIVGRERDVLGAPEPSTVRRTSGEASKAISMRCSWQHGPRTVRGPRIHFARTDLSSARMPYRRVGAWCLALMIAVGVVSVSGVDAADAGTGTSAACDTGATGGGALVAGCRVERPLGAVPPEPRRALRRLRGRQPVHQGTVAAHRPRERLRHPRRRRQGDRGEDRRRRCGLRRARGRSAAVLPPSCSPVAPVSRSTGAWSTSDLPELVAANDASLWHAHLGRARRRTRPRRVQPCRHRQR